MMPSLSSGMAVMPRWNGSSIRPKFRAVCELLAFNGPMAECRGGEASCERGHQYYALLYWCGQLAERIHQGVERLHEGAQWSLTSLAQRDHEGFERAAQILQIAFQVVVLLGGEVRGVAGLADLLGPFVDAARALRVEHVRSLDGVTAEHGRHGAVALFLGEPAELLLELSGETAHADEVALRVVQGYPIFLGGLPLFFGLVGQCEQHGAQLGAGFGSDDALVRECGQCADGGVDTQAELAGSGAHVVQRLAEIAYVAEGFAGSCGEQVGDMRGVGAGQIELGHGRAHVFGGLADFHAVGRCEVQCAAQTAGENIGGR